MFNLPELPYAFDALEPHMSARTLRCHYGDHHRGYVDKLNDAIVDVDFEFRTIEDLVRRAAGRDDLKHVYDNAAQVANHAFFWNCMKPSGGGQPGSRLKQAIDRDFGSFAAFRNVFIERATGRFGSGYVWLVRRGDELVIRDTGNADPPYVLGRSRDGASDDPILCCDLWEHAYYLDYENARGEFVATFLDRLTDWDFVAARFDRNVAQPQICMID